MSRSYKKTPWCGDRKGKSEWRSYRWICSMFPNREHKEPDNQECYRKWLKYYHSK